MCVLDMTTLVQSGGVSSGLANSHGLLSLLAELFASSFKFTLGKVIKGQALNNAPFLVSNGNWEAEHDSFRCAVTAIRKYTLTDKFT